MASSLALPDVVNLPQDDRLVPQIRLAYLDGLGLRPEAFASAGFADYFTLAGSRAFADYFASAGFTDYLASAGSRALADYFASAGSHAFADYFASAGSNASAGSMPRH